MKGSSGKLVRRGSLGLLAATALLAAGSSGATATAATTFGQTFPPIDSSGRGTFLQTSSPGGQYEAPAPGVITSFSFQAFPDPAGVPQLKLKVARRAGGNNFTIVGESRLVTPVAGTLNTFPVQIPVLAGDVLGYYSHNQGNVWSLANLPGYGIHVNPVDVPPGTTQSYFSNPPPSRQFDISATVETTPCTGKPPTVAGTAGDDTLTGTPGVDVIVGLEGKDAITGLAGGDFICGGAGKDILKGGAGRDKLLGQQASDSLKGGGGKDTCKGGKGNDRERSC